MCANRLFIAAAGSGKTSLIVEEALTNPTEKILITTFTQANEQSIRQRLIKSNKGSIPPNVTVQPWFSFLIEHGVKPYRFWDCRVSGMELVATASGIKYKLKNGTPVPWGEDENFNRHYFNSNMDVYSDKLSKLVIRCNEKSAGNVINRLVKIYAHIYIDEVQDMAGWDLEIIKLLLQSQIRLTMVGDPRQTVYLTHHDRKYPKYAYGKIKDFIAIECKKIHVEIDEKTLNNSFRNSDIICKLSSELYPELSECMSQSDKTNNHMGIYFVKKCDAQTYYKYFNPMQLRLRKDTVLSVEGPAMNFGESKGLEANHVLIYPTADMLKWLCKEKVQLKDKTKAQLYVALTRAFFSIGIIVNDNFTNKTNINIWQTINE